MPEEALTPRTSNQQPYPADLAIELSGITKRFPGVVANSDVHLAVGVGEVHAVVGENGAGKSTLMKILYGMLQPDEGSISVNGHTQHFRSPKDAISAGIGMVHQHFMLADNFTVLENVVLGSEPGTVALDSKTARSDLIELGERYGLEIDPDRLVESLAVGERQRVEILKVLYRGARILILDEPTTVLVPQEVTELFDNLRELKKEGVTIIFISHKLDEVLDIADRITVIRGGKTVDTVTAGEVDAHRLAELMVGSELPTPETRTSTVTNQAELKVSGLTMTGTEGRRVLDDISFTIHRGEILGIAGVEGNGQRELVDALVSIEPIQAGQVSLGDQDITHKSTAEIRQLGVGLIPEDRHRQALLLSSPLWENTMLGHQYGPPFLRSIWVDKPHGRDRTTEIISDFGVMAPGPDTPAVALSGGNQQKLVIGREMIASPRVLIAAQPTRGVDVGAQAAIWEDIRNARENGMAVLLISADLEELIGLSDTLQVIYRGRLVAKLDPAQVTPEELGSYMTGVRTQDLAA